MGALFRHNLQDYIDKYNLKQYVETGTGKGECLEYANRYDFDGLYSVDIDEELYYEACRKFSKNKNINLFNSLSTDFLLNLSLSKEPTLFFLDAHFPGADFHKCTYEESIRTHQKDAFPLESEIKIITRIRNTSKDVFIIDDLMLYEPDQYECLKEGCVWKYEWLQDELNLKTNSTFLYETFFETHNFYKDLRDQGYLIITPK